jgi:hypothetical protein
VFVRKKKEEGRRVEEALHVDLQEEVPLEPVPDHPAGRADPEACRDPVVPEADQEWGLEGDKKLRYRYNRDP